jgi:L-glyceraldehyde 3-phosphate reductase
LAKLLYFKESEAFNFHCEKGLTPEKLDKISALNEIVAKRGQTLAQLALVWVLRDSKITSVIIEASKPEQIVENIHALDNPDLSKEEIDAIEGILNH